VQRAVTAGAPAVGLAYLALTLLGALVAVWAGAAATAGLVRRVRRADG
jgi:fluoride exporter